MVCIKVLNKDLQCFESVGEARENTFYFSGTLSARKTERSLTDINNNTQRPRLCVQMQACVTGGKRARSLQAVLIMTAAIAIDHCINWKKANQLRCTFASRFTDVRDTQFRNQGKRNSFSDDFLTLRMIDTENYELLAEHGARGRCSVS